ncbi:hypothetical protein Poli38472_007048 [Pythium oligandrum]|uniref:Uncharacterized protein n=1 Tax=Pythium oligandrum TaxID=41045 RepID=A0A8K1FHM0_PYTOL|nr:hypothetical protein Poli38472_007048 [Pythium oligandrum]|eukprot:TMW58903.1 hypothetical protein Poli38472_007048 [Pythium oligandrum]
MTLSAGGTYAAMLATLVAVAIYAIHASRSMEVTNLKNFVSAKNSQTALRLAWCFFSAGMGSWTLFSFPEIGVTAGSWGVIGYTLSGVFALVALGLFGPFSRSVLGDGETLTDFVFNRYGRVMQIYVGFVSVFYQFISLASELTTVGELAAILSPNAEPSIPIVAVAVVTNIYLLIGGLRASLATDVWQGIGVVGLLLIVCVAMFAHVDIPKGAWSETNVAAFTTEGFETLVTLCIAVTAANLFFTGYWQRVYAAYDDRTLYKATFFACLIVIPFTIILALSGMVSYLAYPDGIYFFAILVDMGTFWQVLVAMVVASLASSVADSIQIGIAAEFVTNFPSLTITHARAICVLLNVPAIFIALKHYNIINLFLIADLLCTATVGPMLLGIWHRAHPTGAIAGCAVGLLTIFVNGWIVQGKFVGGFNWFLLPEGLYSVNSMITFILALVIPTVTTIGVSLALPPQQPARGAYLPANSPSVNAA